MEVYELVDGELVESVKHKCPYEWNNTFLEFSGDVWVAGLQWDTGKASKPSSINKPILFDKDLTWYNQLKGTSVWGMYLVITENENDCLEAFKLLCHKLVDRRESALKEQLEEFRKISKKFLEKHAK